MTSATQPSYSQSGRAASVNTGDSREFLQERSRRVSGIQGNGWESNKDPFRTKSNDTSFSKADRNRAPNPQSKGVRK